MRFVNAMVGSNAVDYPAIAAACEQAGFDAVALSDHIFQPAKLNSTYPYTADGTPQYPEGEDWPDPWVMVGAMSAATSTIRFLTNVYVLPLRNPFITAKAAGTAALVSNNRVTLGVGAGWMREEFDVLGQPFARRGARMEEAIEVLRTLWSGGFVEYHGTYYDFPSLDIAPTPTEPIPIYIGGTSELALRRAAAIGDGWIGMYGTVDELREQIGALRRFREEAGRADEPFDVCASPLVIPRPEAVAELEQLGLTTILTSAWVARGHQRVERSQALDLVAEYGERILAPLRS